jgi:hypothetical protein
MVDTGEADKLVNYKAAGNSVASRHAGLCYSVQARRSRICAPTEATAEKPPSQQPFGLCTPINPVCGGTPTQSPPPSPYLTIGMLLPNAGYTLEETFVCPGVEKYRTSGKSRFYPIPKLPVRLSHWGNNHHPTAQQNEARGVFQVTAPHSYTSVNISTSVSVSDPLLDSSYKMSVTATLISRISIHIDASPISNMLWPC